MSVGTLTAGDVKQNSLNNEEDSDVQSSLLRRQEKIQEFFRGYFKVTLQETGAASVQQSKDLEGWALNFNPTKKEIEDRENFLKKYEKQMESAKKLYYVEFMQPLDDAAQTGLISEESKKKWIARFRDPSIPYKTKEYWVRKQFPQYIQQWKAIFAERNTLLDEHLEFFAEIKKRDPFLSSLTSKGVNMQSILSKEKFRALHHDKKKEQLSRLRAAILAIKKGREDRFMQAKTLLNKAVIGKAMSKNKVGRWLERIMESKSSDAAIDQFLSHRMPELIQNWFEVKSKYDACLSKVMLRGKSNARGLNILPEQTFLSLGYEQRVSYVGMLEERLKSANDVQKDNPLFITIRHDLDIRDWGSAEEHVTAAERTNLTPQERERLGAMKRYLKQMRRTAGKKHSKEKKGPVNKVDAAVESIESIMKNIPSTMQSMVLQLLQGPHAARSIHQLRWITGNNDWVHRHNWTNPKKAQKALNRENLEKTKRLGPLKKDMGRINILTGETPRIEHVRDDRFARKRATGIYLDLGCAQAKQTLTNKLMTEMDPKVCYWMTLFAYEEGITKSARWHKELFDNLTGLRKAAKTLETAGYRYNALSGAVPISSGPAGTAILN